MPSIASIVPPELLHMIFSYAVEMERAAGWRYGMPSKHSTRKFALVCRSWKYSAHCILYKTVAIADFATWDHCSEVLNANSELASYVRSLRFEIWLGPMEPRKWTVADLSALLQLIPYLTTFVLSLNDSLPSPGYKGDYSALAILPNLRHLSLRSSQFDENLISYRQILQKTPNLTSLSLATGYSRVHFLPTRQKILAIHLPSLTKLSLSGEQLTRLFDKIKLLTEATLENVVDLSLICKGFGQNPDEIREHNAGILLRQIGHQLQKLEITTEGAGGLLPAEILQYCPNITTLVGEGPPAKIGSLPPLVRELNLRLPVRDCFTLMNDFVKDVKRDFGNVDTLRISVRSGEKLVASKAVRRVCAAKGITLILNGE